MAKDIEIEIKVQIEHSAPLLDFLQRSGTFESEKHQIDEYFSPGDAGRDFLRVRPVSEWLRLRDAEGNYSINYKYWHYNDDGTGKHADEFETPIAEVDQARKILLALGFKPIVTVDKLRKTWIYDNYEIAIDTVKDLGDFVEIEYRSSANGLDSNTITSEMLAFLKQRGCGTITRDHVGYPFLLLFPNEARLETQA